MPSVLGLNGPMSLFVEGYVCLSKVLIKQKLRKDRV